MVRRNPYKMKKEKFERTRKEAILKWKAEKGKRKEAKKKRETYADSMPGVVFSLLQTVNLRAGTYADDDKKRIQQAHAAAGRPKTVVAGGGK